ncbi:MAG TPA: Ig-like domain-containing protein, partial [Gemmatimonadales bacterium]|nr:Ig-like domain-containing protein [Gemmatimonadales bacterium]
MSSSRRFWPYLLLALLTAVLRCGGDITVPAEGLPSHMAILAGDGQSAVVGSPLSDSLVVRVTDSKARPVQDLKVEFKPLGTTGDDLIPDTAVTSSDGQAWTRWVLGTKAGLLQVQARVLGPTRSGLVEVTFSADARPGAPDTVYIVSGDGQSAQAGGSVADPLVVLVTDRFGNPLANQVIEWTAENGGTMSTQTSATGPSGQAENSWELGPKVGVQISHATISGVPGSPLDFTATAVPGNAAQLVFIQQPTTTAAGQSIAPPLTVRVEDANGNTVQGSSVSVTVALGSNSPGGSLSGTTTVNAINGVATFGGLSLDRAGNDYTIVASASGGIGLATSAKFDIIPGLPAKLAIVTQPAANASSAVLLSPQPVVRLQDAMGNPVRQSNVPVTAAITSGGGILGGTTTVGTNSSGVAAYTDLVLSGSVGERTLLFSAPGLQAVASTPVNLAIGAPANIALNSGNGQSAPVGMAVPVPPSAKVTDASGNPVPQTTVRFAVGSGGGTVTGATPVTDANGIAAVGSWQLGSTKGTNSLTATVTGVSGSLTFTATARFAYLELAAGAEFSCGISTAKIPYCWGRNDRGQIGNGNLTDQRSPVQVTGGFQFVTIGLGDSHACGIVASGAAFCWGRNSDGQLGDGTTSDRHTPNPVIGNFNFSSIDGGESHTCGLTQSGDAYCWGRNDRGQLGDGTRTDRDSPVPVTGGIHFATIQLGARHTCGLSTGGTVYCWGANADGQLGDGSTTDHSSPTAVAGNWDAITVGEDFGCALGTGGSASCWGRNDKGQIGDGTTRSRSSPTPVSGGLSFIQLDAGDRHVCGIVTARNAYCWGQNNDGELGDGTTSDRQSPVAVQGSRAFASVNGGGLHTLAL